MATRHAPGLSPNRDISYEGLAPVGELLRMRELAMVALLVATPAAADPIALKCEVTLRDGAIRHLNVSLNETTGIADFVLLESGWTERRPAIFSGDKVSWVIPGKYWSTTYEVNRVTLQFRSRTSVDDRDDWKGECLLDKAAENRKF